MILTGWRPQLAAPSLNSAAFVVCDKMTKSIAELYRGRLG